MAVVFFIDSSLTKLWDLDRVKFSISQYSWFLETEHGAVQLYAWYTQNLIIVVKISCLEGFFSLKGRELTSASDLNFWESSYHLGTFAPKSPLICSILVGETISLKATLPTPKSLISFLQKYRKEVGLFDTYIFIEADEIICTVISSSKTVSTHLNF